MSRKNTRRKFLQTTAVIGAGYWTVGNTKRVHAQGANEAIQLASIGVEGKGRSDSTDAMKSGDLIALCDVDERSLDKADARVSEYKAEKGKSFKSERFFDYREMLDKMGDKIDAVTVSTPDHNHAPAAAMAMRMGKHCFCQKPMTHSIFEARTLGDIAREQGVATQMGNQGTSYHNLRKAVAIIKTGVLGDISDVHVWTNRPVWPQGIERPAGQPVPRHVKWEQWIGPAPMRPYNEAYHPFKWRGFWDFGTGALGDMACHTLNMPYMALELRDPVSVEAQSSGHNKETYPSQSKITFEFPARGDRGAVTMIWYDGGNLPSVELLDGNRPANSGALVVGTKGKLYAPGDYAEKPLQLFGGIEEPEVTYKRSPGHFTEWIDAIKGGEAAMSNFPDYAGPLTETILLGNLAVWSGKKVDWDAKNLKALNAPELNDTIVRREYRDGYTL